MYSDHTVDIAITDPDLRWDDASSTWQLYYHGPNSTDYQSPITPMIRHAASADLATWTVDDAPALVAATDAGAWDHMTTETCSIRARATWRGTARRRMTASTSAC